MVLDLLEKLQRL